ncbi:MAG: DUF4388 domain-containing protein [Planctomycetes bacterium]|nr:DUF4388 domain-containing protein [Planctomycetota bacterium]
MGFAGNLQTLTLADVLQTLNRIHGSGVLRLASAHGGREVVFANGEIIGVDLKEDGRNSLIRLLIALGKIDVDAAATISEGGGGSNAIVDALVQRGLLSANEIQEVQAKQAMDELYDIWTWNFGDFVFAEAGADAEATGAVERWRKQALKVNLTSLLMESARRQDEWTRLASRFEKDDWVLAIEPGCEDQIAQAAKEYPASAVLPLVDGVRAVSEVQKASVATRLDVYAVIADQLDLGTLRTCTGDDLLAFADHLAERADMHRAADLYTKVLARRPDDVTTVDKLADILQRTDQFATAGTCYQRLALAQLACHRPAEATVAARRSIELQPQSPESRLALVRCLVDAGDNATAIAELRKVAFIYQKMGRLEDARGTCLKILELDPTDKEVHKDLAQIFAKAENDVEAEDVAVCAQCGEVNARDATACKGCAAKLRLSCPNCTRTIAVSDRLCIFCGSDPGNLKRRLPSSPATSRIIDTSKVRKDVQATGSASWRSKIEASVKAARAAEAVGDIPTALAAWKDAAQLQVDNVELSQHIRRLESAAHENHIEGQIERGHQLRRQRRFFRAARAYQAALRSMGAKDERAEPLRSILVSTERSHLRVSMIYGAAAIVLVCLGVMVAKPFVQERRFMREGEEFAAQMEGAPGAPNAEVALALVTDMRARLDLLELAADDIRPGKQADHVRTRLVELTNQYGEMRAAAAARAFAEAQAHAEGGDAAALASAIERLRLTVAEADPQRLRALDDRLVALRQGDDERARALADAPTALATAKDHEKNARLGLALNVYEALAASEHVAASAAAKEAVARLKPEAEAFAARWNALIAAMDVDLVKARDELVELSPAAKQWNHEAEMVQRQGEVARRLKEATTAFTALGKAPDEAALRAFLEQHKGAPQSLQVRARLNQAATQSKVRDEALARYQRALDAAQIDEAWKQARILLAEHRSSLPADAVRLPLQITTQPIGAIVAIDGVEQGRTPLVVAFDPQTARNLTLTLAGHKPVAQPIADLAADWSWKAVLEREPTWTARLGRRVAAAHVADEGRLLLNAGDLLVCLDATGRERWRRPLMAGGNLINVNEVRMAHAPVAMGDGAWAFGMIDRGMVVVDGADGSVRAQYATEEPVRGAPVIYANDILGGAQRMAFAAEELITVANEQVVKLPVPGGVLSGPVAIENGLDRMLVVATMAGRLRAIEESTRDLLWEHDLGASDIGQLIPSGDGGLITVLDASRLVCFDLRPEAASQRWSVELSALPQGDPLVVAGMVLLACGNQIIRHGVAGTAATPLPLPSLASSAVAAAAGDRIAVGCKGGELVVFNHDGVVWTNPCGQPVTAVCLADGLVVAGMADGTVDAFAP